MAVDQLDGIYQAYLQAEPKSRRLLNQAFFSKLFVVDEEVTGAVFAEPSATILHPEVRHLAELQESPEVEIEESKPLSDQAIVKMLNEPVGPIEAAKQKRPAMPVVRAFPRR